jgi:cell shape-determining protein MreC
VSYSELASACCEWNTWRADVKAGDTVVTSGIDGIYPKGFVIGTIESVGGGSATYKTIRVRPSVDFNGLEEVLVVKTPPAQVIAQQGPS